MHNTMTPPVRQPAARRTWLRYNSPVARHELSPYDRDLFLTVEDLAHRGLAVTPAALEAAVSRYFGYAGSVPGTIHRPMPQAALVRLERAGLLRSHRLRPTRRGRRYVEAAVERYFEERGLSESAESTAFRDLCRDRQGIAFCQHGTLTAVQYGALHEAAQRALVRSPGRALEGGAPRVLDLGCGTGELGLALAGRLSAALTGVDSSLSAIEHARRRRTHHAGGPATGTPPRGPSPGADFHHLRIEDAAEKLAGEPRHDIILAVDSLYWLDDPEAALAGILRLLRPGGVFLGLESRFEERRRGAQTLAWEDTDLGAALGELQEAEGSRFRLSALDFTGEERRIWLETPAVCAGREEAFAAEGRLYVLRNLLREAEELDRAVRHGRGARYLSILERVAE